MFVSFMDFGLACFLFAKIRNTSRHVKRPQQKAVISLNSSRLVLRPRPQRNTSIWRTLSPKVLLQ